MFREGKIVILKEVDSDTETKQYYKNHTKRLKYKKRFNPNQFPFKTEDSAPEEESIKKIKKSFPKKRYSRNVKKEENIDPSSKDKEVRLIFLCSC